MPHTQQISSARPGCLLFLVDQSGSMARSFVGPDGQGMTRADGVALAVNRLIQESILACSSGEAIRDRLHMGLITYAGKGVALAGGAQGLRSVSELHGAPLRQERRPQQIPDGAGGLVTREYLLNVWVDPQAEGGTPMRAAAEQAYDLLEPWVQAHPDSFPPVLINITDGESTDGDPVPALDRIRSLATHDGNALVLNLLLSDKDGAKRVAWPVSPAEAPEGNLRRLVEASSVLPEGMVRRGVESRELNLRTGCRGVVLNGGMVDMIQMLDIGTPMVAGDSAA